MRNMVFLAGFFRRLDARTRRETVRTGSIWGRSRFSEAYPVDASGGALTTSNAIGSR
jgi:hypothetical protein